MKRFPLRKFFLSGVVAFIAASLGYLFFVEELEVKKFEKFNSDFERNEIVLKNNLANYSKILNVFSFYFRSSTNVSREEFQIFAKGILLESDVSEICWHSETGEVLSTLRGNIKECGSFDILEPIQMVTYDGLHFQSATFVENQTQRGYISLLVHLDILFKGVVHENTSNFLLLRDTLKNQVLKFDLSSNTFVKSSDPQFAAIHNRYSEILNSNNIGFTYVSFLQDGIELDSLQRTLLVAIFLVTFLSVGLINFLVDTKKEIEKRVISRTTDLNREVVLRRDAQLRAEELARAKTQFLANVSHEIRTPLNGILGSIQLCLSSDLPKQTLELLNLCSASGKNLLSLLNDILDFAKLDSSQMKLEISGFNPGAAVSSVIRVFEPLAHEKGVKLKFNNFLLDRFFMGDELRFKQIAQNFISNAIKFTENGEVEITVEEYLDLENSHVVVLSVKDSGIGIDEDFKRSIFMPFQQEDETYVRRFGGTGLGLSICRKIADLMGGEIKLESSKGIGSTFIFKVNLKETEAVKITDATDSCAMEVLNISGKVLIVEDNPINAILLSKFLERLNVSYEVADNGQVALDKIEKEKFSLVLMDIQMPVMNGIDATRQIRKTKNATTLPIIALSANAFEDNRLECLEVGVNEFMSKPVEFARLKIVISKYLNSHIDGSRRG